MARHNKRLEATLGQLAPATPSLLTQPCSFTYKLSDNCNGLLNEAQRQQYEQDGFIIIKGLLSKEQIAVYRQRFMDYADGKLERPVSMVMMRDVAVAKKKELGERAITKIQDWHVEDDVMFGYAQLPEIQKYAHSIIGRDIYAIHSMLINKPPDVGIGSSRHPPHQDLWYFPYRPADKIVATWTAMQKIDKQNGCLFVYPGSHKIGKLYKHAYPNDGVVNKAYHGIQNMPELEGDVLAVRGSVDIVYAEMEEGDTIFFHPLLIHGSGPNNTKGFRKAISVHFRSAKCNCIDVKGTLQEEIAKEVEEMAIKKGIPMEFSQLWDYKSRKAD